MRKGGISGEPHRILLIIIGALIGFILLYLFLSHTTEGAIGFSQETIAGLKKDICSMFGPLKLLMGC